MSECNKAVSRIIRRHTYSYAVSYDYFNFKALHLATEARVHFDAIIKHDSIYATACNVRNLTIELY